MNDFEFDCYEKKKLAHQAKHRVGLRKGCSLSTDRMTQKEWKDKCEEIMSFNLNMPIKWNDFKKLSMVSQHDYIKNVQDKYRVTQSRIADMMGVSKGTYSVYMNTHYKDLCRGKKFFRMTEEDKERWNKFLSESNTKNKLDKTTEKKDVTPNETNLDNEPASKMVMSEMTMKFDGNLNTRDICNSIWLVLGKDAVGTVEIGFKIKSN